jgi:hypothetical protein
VKTAAWIRNLAAIAILLPSPAPAREFEVTVTVGGVCTLPAGALDRALKTATELFVPTGVKLRFAAIEQEQPGADAIWLRLMARAPRHAGPRVLGAAMMASRPPAALVFCDRIMEFAQPGNSKDTGVLLGYAISHELGHILRNEPGHCGFGVMKATWRHTDIVLMLQGVMAFSNQDRAHIQAGLTAREQTRRMTARAK